MIRRVDNQNGMALILTLLILTLLVVTGLELNRAVRVEATLAGNFRDLTQAAHIARAGTEVARVLLKLDDPTYDSLEENWGQFQILAQKSTQLFPEGNFTGRIVDEDSKFSVNGLMDPYGNVNLKKKGQLERLFTFLGKDPEIIPAVLDWLDTDDVARVGGAERDYYSRLKPPYTSKNGPLDSLGEILWIKGIEPPFFYGTREKEGLRDYITVYSDHRININTASLPVLMSLSPGVDQAMAQAVIARRLKKAFRKSEELRLVAGWELIYAQISSEIAVRSNYFSIEVTGTYRDARAEVQAVVKREGKRTRIIYWRSG